MPEGVARRSDEPEEHGLSPTLTQVRDDVQNRVDRSAPQGPQCCAPGTAMP